MRKLKIYNRIQLAVAAFWVLIFAANSLLRNNERFIIFFDQKMPGLTLLGIGVPMLCFPNLLNEIRIEWNKKYFGWQEKETYWKYLFMALGFILTILGICILTGFVRL